MAGNGRQGSASKIRLDTFDDLFGGNAAQDDGGEKIINAPLEEL